jgi:hypothetical protein
MPARIPVEEWNIERLDTDRRRRLLQAPDAVGLLEMLLLEMDRFPAPQLEWEDAKSKLGYQRAWFSVPCSRDLFDYLFNGPTGYRAQYYHSPCAGVAYNGAIKQALALKAISLQHSPVEFAARTSLAGPWSKIWPLGNGATFSEAPENQLRARRWVEHNERASNMGLRAPLPKEPRVKFIGTWVEPVSSEVWLSPDKVDRAMRLHYRGYA